MFFTHNQVGKTRVNKVKEGKRDPQSLENYIKKMDWCSISLEVVLLLKHRIIR